jgi:hypothetical protein
MWYTSPPLVRAVAPLFLPYPFLVVVGALCAIALPISSARAVYVGLAALGALILLTCLYLHELWRNRPAIQDLTVWFYLSHAATLLCVIVCIHEYNQASSSP